jgi:hypothetical protein
MNKLITNIELLSNQKSFRLGISNTSENLWFLLHFKELEILNTVIYHQQYSEFRASKNTKYPIRRLKKKFADTADFLDYLTPSSKPSRRFFIKEIEFTNGWKVKEQPHIYFTIYTNSLDERNTLINHLINSVGYDSIAIDSLKPNITYYFKASGTLLDYKLGVSPDEFWSEERLEKWKEDVYKKNNTKEVQDDNKDNSEENVFVSTLNISEEFTGIKLEGWTEGDPF